MLLAKVLRILYVNYVVVIVEQHSRNGLTGEYSGLVPIAEHIFGTNNAV